MPRSLSAGLRFIPGCAANFSAWRLNSSGYFFMSTISAYPDPIGQSLSPQNRGKITQERRRLRKYCLRAITKGFSPPSQSALSSVPEDPVQVMVCTPSPSGSLLREGSKIWHNANCVLSSLHIGVWRSPASALAWGVRGPRFESGYPDSGHSSSPSRELFVWKGRTMQSTDVRLTSLAKCAG